MTKRYFDQAEFGTVSSINNVELISSSDDLPDVENGRHQLETQTAYKFSGFVSSQYGLELANSSPLLGTHGGIDGFIHTGGGTAIYGRDSHYFSADMYVHAPGGTIYDLQATQSEEMLVESVSMNDAAGLGEIGNLGTIDGFRVPSFKGCNFGDFKAGLTLTGTPNKIFFEASPFRGVTESGVTMFEYDANFDGDVVDYTDNYVKQVQSDTEVIRVDASATINDVFQYRGTTHGQSVTEDNILVGAAGSDVVGYRVSDAYPIADSVAVANYFLDSASTVVSITTQATSKTDESAYVTIPGTTSSNASARFTLGDNEATYDGKKTTLTHLQAVTSLGTSSGDRVSIAWFADGSLVAGTATRVLTSGTGNAVGKSVSSIGVDMEATSGTTYDARVANLDSTTDVDVGELNASLDANL